MCRKRCIMRQMILQASYIDTCDFLIHLILLVINLHLILFSLGLVGVALKYPIRINNSKSSS